MSNIHHTALIDRKANLDPTVTVGPFSVIGPEVKIGANTSIGSHCVIDGRTSIGVDNVIHNYAALGGAPQDKKYAGEETDLVIGDRNTIREFCTFNRGTVFGGGVTKVGSDNLFMAYVHLAHDCNIGSHTIFANNSQLAGHVLVGDWVILGGFTVVRQFLRLGNHSFTAMCSLLFADLPPFMTCEGQPADARSVNVEGLKRRGFTHDRIAAIREMYKILYRENLTLDSAKTNIQQRFMDSTELMDDVDLMCQFLSNVGKSGIVRQRVR